MIIIFTQIQPENKIKQKNYCNKLYLYFWICLNYTKYVLIYKHCLNVYKDLIMVFIQRNGVLKRKIGMWKTYFAECEKFISSLAASIKHYSLILIISQFFYKYFVKVSSTYV